MVSARAAGDAGGRAGLAVPRRALAGRASPSVALNCCAASARPLGAESNRSRSHFAGRLFKSGTLSQTSCHGACFQSGWGGERAGRPRASWGLTSAPDLHGEGLRGPWDRERSVNQSLDSLQARGSWEKQTGNEKTRTKHPTEGDGSTQKRELEPEGRPAGHACWGRGAGAGASHLSPGRGLSR